MKRYGWAILGIVAMAIGGFLIYIYTNDQRNMMMAGLAGLVLIASGAYVAYKGFKTGSVVSGGIVTHNEKDIRKQTYNSLIFEGQELPNKRTAIVGIKLEKVDKPEQYGGIPHKIENNGQSYYFFTRLTTLPENGSGVRKVLTPYVQQDTKFYPPTRLAKYIGLAGIKDAFSLHEDPMKLIGPGLIVVGMVVAFIAIVAI